MKPNFSIVLIARNEEKTLPRLLESLQEFRARGGEIVLVDTGSKDKTAQIARDAGCKVEEVGNRFRKTIGQVQANAINERFVVVPEEPVVAGGDSLFDYSAARNYAASLASNDMVAMPDCDEVYTKFVIDDLVKEIESGVDQLEYSFVFSHDNEGNDLIKFNHCKFYNRKKLEWTGIIHEVLRQITEDQPVRKFLEENVIKLEHWQNPETNRGGYLKGLAFDCFLNPDNDRNSHYFAREMFYLNRHKSAIREFKRHIAMNGWSTEKSESFNYMGRSYLALGMRTEAISCFVQALDIEPRRREPLMHLAEMYYREKNADLAIVYSAAALQIKGTPFYANYQPYYEYVPHEILYWALYQKGEVGDAKTHFDVCLSYNSYNEKYLFDMRWFYNLPMIKILTTPDVAHVTKDLNYPEDLMKIEYTDGPFDVFAAKFNDKVSTDDDPYFVYLQPGASLHSNALIIAIKTMSDNGKKIGIFSGSDSFIIHKSAISEMTKHGPVLDVELGQSGAVALLARNGSLKDWTINLGKAVVTGGEKTEFSQEEIEKRAAVFAQKFMAYGK